MPLDARLQQLHDLDLLLRSIPGARSSERALPEALRREVEALQEAHRSGVAGAALIVRSTRRALPAWRQGESDEPGVALGTELPLEQAQRAIARWHGFVEWSQVALHAETTVDPHFEAAIDAIVDGDADALGALLARHPPLAHARSPFAHRATLLHHVAANGIESNRQWQTPSNAVAIAEILLAAGAAPDATCVSYGAGDTVLGLLLSSAHPARAGVQADLVEALCRAGASPDGPGDDGSPLWTAITFGYTAAAERLVRCGARVDNLIFAAVAGDLAAVETFIDDDGRAKPTRVRSVDRAGTAGPALDPEHLVDYALIYAAGHGRLPVVEFLLTKNPSLAVKEPVFQGTALGWAEHHDRREVVARLRRCTAARE